MFQGLGGSVISLQQTPDATGGRTGLHIMLNIRLTC